MPKLNIDISKSVAIFMAIMTAAVVMLSMEVYRLHKSPIDIIKSDTLIFRDTIFEQVPIISPIPIASKFLRTEFLYIPRILFLDRDSIVDSPINHDSVRIEIPIEQKIYSDDSMYIAWVSGFHPSLDSLMIKRPLIHETMQVSQIQRDARRISLGVSVGGGYGLISRRFDVFVGLTVQVRLF